VLWAVVGGKSSASEGVIVLRHGFVSTSEHVEMRN